MRIGVLMELAPRKRGSFEHWLVEITAQLRARGHRADVFGFEPVHPEVAEAWAKQGTGWFPLDEVRKRPLEAVRRFAAYDLLQLHLIANRSPSALLAYAAYPAQVMFVDHDSTEPRAPASPLRNVCRAALDRLSAYRTNSIIGVSEYVTRRARARFAGATVAETIYNGIDFQHFPRERAPHPRGEPATVMAVANLIPEKGLHVLLQALSLLEGPAPRLRIVGDGPEQGRLRWLAGELGLRDRVEFLGLRNDVPALLAACDVFVHPALWTEAFGYTIAEAMASGAPVIASNVGGIPELLDRGRVGELVEPGNAPALARALDRLLASPELRNQRAELARQRVESLFTLAVSARAHVEWCEARVAARARGRAEPTPAALRPS